MLPNNPGESGISPEATRGGFLAGIAMCREFKRRGCTAPIILISCATMNLEAKDWAYELRIPFVAKDEGPRAMLRALEQVGILKTGGGPKALIVYGHDEIALSELKDFLRNTLKWQEPIVLREQPSQGKTVIEKFEEFAARADCVFVLLTPDDAALTLSTDDERRKARQNVIFELGFFYAHLGRKTGRVIALRKGRIELPSDIEGIIWIDITSGVNAVGNEIRREVMHIEGELHKGTIPP